MRTRYLIIPVISPTLFVHEIVDVLYQGKKQLVQIYLDRWTGFEAAHIFPLGYEGYWIKHNYDRWITIRPELGGAINSVQNGMLLSSDIRQLFDSYDLSINPVGNTSILGGFGYSRPKIGMKLGIGRL
jgi:hypothetical protein